MMAVSVKALEDVDWTFREVKAKEGIHGLHSYPAMMAPPVARTLIQKLSQPGDVVLDPFCGSGTVTTEAALVGRPAIGFDINPLALLIAEVKATPLSPKVIQEAYEQVQDALASSPQPEPPRFDNVDYWFKPEVQNQLVLLKAAIESVDSQPAQKFLWVVFSRVVRETSNTRNNEFKLFRIPPEKLKAHNPNALEVFKRRFHEALSLMEAFWSQTGGIVSKRTLKLHDARERLPVEAEGVQLVLTSPPYGDSKTTVAYGQFSRLSLQWLGMWNDDLDRLSLGGVLRVCYMPPPTLKAALDAIAQASPKRAREAEAFYADLRQCLQNISLTVKPEGYAVFVIANRRVRGVVMPTDRIIVEMMPEFRYIVSLQRQIPNKRMPLRNAPLNVPGETDNTMLEEHIVILQKRGRRVRRLKGQLTLMERRRQLTEAKR